MALEGLELGGALDCRRVYIGVSDKKGYLHYFGVLKNKDPTIQGTILGSPIFGNPPIWSSVPKN